ncbi:MAG: glutamine synthetase family protein [Candidatus Faecousia sp.]|nr:glutamine synthetase family protein [Candidatus Faecousia sp.]
MLYTEEDVFSYVEQEDVKFIRLAFCDVSGKQKNISIMPQELKRAFSQGISFDASAVSGFGGVEESDLFLFPIPSTLTDLPWRPSRGKVVRMLCQIRYPDGTPFPMDCRALLARAIQDARQAGLSVQIGAEFEFYLFKTDADGNPTTQPFDHAGYMDVAPEDKGENVRREICLTLEHMGIAPESSHHEEGPGQNEIDFRYSDAMTAADNALLFTSVVKAVAVSNGLYADFSPKPIADQAGNGLHINISVRQDQGEHVSQFFMAGILEHIREMTAFLNPCDASYRRLGERKAPRYVTWSPGNRSQLIRIPAAQGEYKRMELRSPDPMVNPHLAYALVIYAGLDGVKRKLLPPEPLNVNLYTADRSVTAGLETLPGSLKEARDIATESPFIQSVLPEGFWK